MNSKSFANL
jgi:hypothetical protein